jgi:hypothetical protein
VNRLVRAGASGLAVLALLAGSGCTVGTAEPSGQPASPSSEAGGSPSSGSTDEADGPAGQDDGPDPEELSAAIFDAADDRPPPIGTQTVELPVAYRPGVTTPVTVDVLSLRRTSDATLVRFQMSAPETVTDMSSQALGDSTNTEFFYRTALEDPAAGQRYLPLSYRWDSFDLTEIPDQPVNACLCGYAGGLFVLSPEPMVMDVLYPPLPDAVSSVSFTAPGGLSIPDLPVADAG